MRIVLTIDYSPWSQYSGGAQRSTHHLADTFSKRGHNVTVIYTKPPWEKIDVPEDIPYEIQWAALIANKSKRKATLRPLSAISVYLLVKKILETEHNVVVHTNGEEGGLLHLLKNKYKFGLISEPHHPHYPDLLLNNRKLNFTDYAKLLVKDGKYLLQGSAARNADYCTPPSKWSGNLVQKAFNIQKHKIIPVYNGVPDEFLKYRRTENAQKGPAVYFGRLTQTKGIDTFIEALHILDGRAPNALIVGKGDREQFLRQKVQELGLSNRVTFKSWLNHEELGKLLSKSYMAVLPSRHENFSLAVLSAMCVGLPTISTSVGGTPEIIDHEHNGLLISPDNSSELAKSIDRLYNQDRPSAEILGTAASKHIRSNLTWDHTCDKFEQLYEKALSIQ